jgi:hypothetical protein
MELSVVVVELMLATPVMVALLITPAVEEYRALQLELFLPRAGKVLLSRNLPPVSCHFRSDDLGGFFWDRFLRRPCLCHLSLPLWTTL